jgi:predicted signal transduction protein with EAL and GGDEF domain
MIIGYQVQDQYGNNWDDRPSCEILTEQTAVKELKLARARYGDDNFNMIVILQGDIKEPAFENATHAPLNCDDELSSLASEFDGEVELTNPTDIASLKAINSARRLVQRSTEQFSIVIPDNVDSLWSGEGCGEWLPAMVYIPNKEIY